MLEVSNALATAIDANVAVYGSDGTLTPVQPGTFTLSPHATVHVVLNDSLTNAIGSVAVSSTTPASLVATPANGALEVDLCRTETQLGYGLVTVIPKISGALVMEVRQTNASGGVEVSTALHE